MQKIFQTESVRKEGNFFLLFLEHIFKRQWSKKSRLDSAEYLNINRHVKMQIKLLGGLSCFFYFL